MSKVGKIAVDFVAKTANFNRDVNAARNHLKSNSTQMSRALESIERKAIDATKAINRFGGIALLGAATGMVAFLKHQINVADQMGKLAQSTGTTSEFLSSMALVADQSGTSLESVAKGVQRLSMNMNDMRRGVGESKETFQDLNIQVEAANGQLRSAEDVLKEVADKFSSMEDGADKTAMAMRLFGRAGAELIPMLNAGSGGIEELQKKAEEMGLVIGTQTALEAAYLNDQLDLLKQQAVGTGRSIALGLLPWLIDTLEVIKFAKEESGGLTAAWVALGGAGEGVFSWLFGKTTQQEINEAQKRVESLEASVVRLQSRQNRWGADSDLRRELENLEDARKALSELEKQKQNEEESERKRMEASLERQRKESEARREATEELARQRQDRIESELKEKEAEQEKLRLAREVDQERVRFEQEKTKATQDFAEEYDKLTKSSYDLEMKYIDARYDYYAKFVDDIEKLEEARAKAKAEILTDEQRVTEEFNNAYMRSSSTRIEYEIKLLDDLYKYYAQHVTDKVKLDEWYSNERERILNTGMDSIKEHIDENVKQIKDTIAGWGMSSSQAVADFAISAKGSVSDMVKSMISELMKLMLYQMIFGPMFSAIGRWAGGLFQPVATGTPAGGASGLSPVGIPMMDSGGITNAQGIYRTGPIKEAHIPLSGGAIPVRGGNFTVNIINKIGADVTQQERQTTDGFELDVMIDQAVAQKLTERGSMSNRSMKHNFNAQERLVSR